MTQLKIGVLLPTRELAMTGDYKMARPLAFAEQAEAAGYDSVWTGDSLMVPPRLDPFIVLAGVAVVTSRIALGTAACTVALRQPVISANLVAALDRVSGGRLVMALGAGFPSAETAREFAAVGVPFDERTSRLDETVKLWRQVWCSKQDGVPSSHHGRYWKLESLDRLPPPAMPGGPKLWLAGGNTPSVLNRVARFYDGWLPFLPSPDVYAQAWCRITELADAHGRSASDIAPGVYVTITVHENRERARVELDTYLQRHYGRSLEVTSKVQACCWGTAEECTEWLAKYVRAGARNIVIRFGSIEPDPPLKEILGAARQI